MCVYVHVCKLLSSQFKGWGCLLCRREVTGFWSRQAGLRLTRPWALLLPSAHKLTARCVCMCKNRRMMRLAVAVPADQGRSAAA
jgi:hypothetical protein